MRRFLRPGHARFSLLVSLALASTGCVNLEPVREFAKISTEAAAYSALVERYIQVPEASIRYVEANPSADKGMVRALKRNIEKRETQREPLLALHASLVRYMAALGTLASDNLVNTDKEFKALQKELGEFASSAKLDDATKSKLTAAGALLRLVADAALEKYRERKVIQIMTDADAYVTAITEHMTVLARAAMVDLTIQRAQLESLFDTFPGGVDAATPKTEAALAVAFLAAEEKRERQLALALLKRQTDKYMDLLKGIADAHRAFVENPTKLSKRELLGNLKGRSDELKVIFEAVKEPLIGILPEELKGVAS